MNNYNEVIQTLCVSVRGVPLYMINGLANTQGTGKRKELEKSS